MFLLIFLTFEIIVFQFYIFYRIGLETKKIRYGEFGLEYKYN